MWLLLAVLAQFELQGRLEPPVRASVSLHAASSPFSVSALAGPDGTFRFRGLDPGSYTIAVFVPGSGEMRQTFDIGPAGADKRGRVRRTFTLSAELMNREAAHQVSARALAIPERAKREYEEAQRCLAKRDIAGAIERLDRAVEIAPSYAAAWNNLGTIAYQTQRFPDAERNFRRALEADPDSYEPLVNLGGVLINNSNLEEAWKYNVYAVLRRPGDALAQAQLGMTYLGLNKLDLAEKHLLEAVRLDPGHFSHPQLQLAQLYLRKGDRANAAKQVEAFRVLHPDWHR
ncbi:MAG: tetratricopeptide repeat protein [Bryobacteraceae bacterium]|nr:tetratricopeptide repeat protein [Bryobacteraceae bacterium]